MTTEKTCRKCTDTKPIDQFSADPRYTGGYKNYCKACVKELSAEWRAKNPIRTKLATHRWNSANKEKHREYSRAWMRAKRLAIKQNKENNESSN